MLTNTDRSPLRPQVRVPPNAYRTRMMRFLLRHRILPGLDGIACRGGAEPYAVNPHRGTDRPPVRREFRDRHLTGRITFRITGSKKQSDEERGAPPFCYPSACDCYVFFIRSAKSSSILLLSTDGTFS